MCFTKKEIGGLIIGFTLFLFLGLFTQSLARIIVVGLTTSIGVFIGKADPRSNKTVLDLIKDAKDWRLRQRRYLYVFGRGGIFNDKDSEK